MLVDRFEELEETDAAPSEGESAATPAAPQAGGKSGK